MLLIIGDEFFKQTAHKELFGSTSRHQYVHQYQKQKRNMLKQFTISLKHFSGGGEYGKFVNWGGAGGVS